MANWFINTCGATICCLLSLALIGVIIYFIWKSSKKKKEEKEVEEEDDEEEDPEEGEFEDKDEDDEDSKDENPDDDQDLAVLLLGLVNAAAEIDPGTWNAGNTTHDHALKFILLFGLYLKM